MDDLPANRSLRLQALANATSRPPPSDGLPPRPTSFFGAAAAAVAAPPALADALAGPARALPPLPRPWSDFFDERRTVSCPERGADFNVYVAGGEGPVLLCLHGGGYTGLTWALLAARLAAAGARVRLACPDLRGHGLTRADGEDDLSAASLAADVAALWTAMYGGERPPTVLVGHSMGGAIAVHAAAAGAVPTLEGVAVVDVVEGTALASLPHMAGVLARRPRDFPSLPAAVGWALGGGMSRSVEAAAVSVPAMLVQEAPPAESAGEAAAPSQALGAIAEEGGEEAAAAAAAPAATEAPAGSGEPPEERWVWRTPLERSAPHWDGWYRGLSARFLALAPPKVLVLAGTDRLDRELTVGQMQGRFQLALLPAAGHAVQEDAPGELADILAAFVGRHVGRPRLPVVRRAAAAGGPPG